MDKTISLRNDAGNLLHLADIACRIALAKSGGILTSPKIPFDKATKMVASWKVGNRGVFLLILSVVCTPVTDDG